MYLVQIGSRESYGRYSGVGQTLEKATADLYHHFQPFPEDITVSRLTTSVYKRCEGTSGFKPLSKKETVLAIQIISETFERLRSS